jgi:hypothetical protein
MRSKLKRKISEKVSHEATHELKDSRLTRRPLKVSDCVSQSKNEAMLRTEDLMRLREELQDASKLQ